METIDFTSILIVIREKPLQALISVDMVKGLHTTLGRLYGCDESNEAPSCRHHQRLLLNLNLWPGDYHQFTIFFLTDNHSILFFERNVSIFCSMNALRFLTHLDLRNNKLYNVIQLQGLNRLQVLRLSVNEPLTSLDFGIQDMSQLKTLDIDHCPNIQFPSSAVQKKGLAAIKTFFTNFYNR